MKRWTSCDTLSALGLRITALRVRGHPLEGLQDSLLKPLTQEVGSESPVSPPPPPLTPPPFPLTGEHGEDGGEGVEFESVDDVARVEELETHEAEAHHQQQDVEHLGHHGQPQHTCTQVAEQEAELLMLNQNRRELSLKAFY